MGIIGTDSTEATGAIAPTAKSLRGRCPRGVWFLTNFCNSRISQFFGGWACYGFSIFVHKYFKLPLFVHWPFNVFFINKDVSKIIKTRFYEKNLKTYIIVNNLLQLWLLRQLTLCVHHWIPWRSSLHAASFHIRRSPADRCSTAYWCEYATLSSKQHTNTR